MDKEEEDEYGDIEAEVHIIGEGTAPPPPHPKCTLHPTFSKRTNAIVIASDSGLKNKLAAKSLLDSSILEEDMEQYKMVQMIKLITRQDQLVYGVTIQPYIM